jgi:hypothetical protein
MELERISYTQFNEHVVRLTKDQLESAYVCILEYYWHRQCVIANLTASEAPCDLLVQASLATATIRSQHYHEDSLVEEIDKVFFYIKKQSLELSEFRI